MNAAHARGVVLLAALAVVWSCDHSVPEPLMSPLFVANVTGNNGNNGNNGHDSAAEQQPDLRYIARFKQLPASPMPLTGHMMIGPEGGSFRVGDFEIVVPPGAVDRKHNFRIRRPVDPWAGEHAYAEFAPHITFLKSVTIRLPQSSTTAEDGPAVLWWSGFQWESLDTRSTADGRIEADVTHFSYYGTSRWAKGITTLGG